MNDINSDTSNLETEFSGNLFFFHAFDVGDDINLNAIEKSQILMQRPLNLPKYFKDYHTPIEVEVPHPHEHSAFFSTKIHNYGAISITYKVPFSGTFQELRLELDDLDSKYLEYAVSDAASIFKKIKKYILQPKFFHIKNSYLVIQVDMKKDMDPIQLKQKFGQNIASLLRFEVKNLSDYQKNEILKTAIGYYKNDLVVIDTDATFICDDDYAETLDLFEFANIQQLEMRYFDRTLNNQLSAIYERKIRPLTFKSYLPFIKNRSNEDVEALERLKVDISVITERLESSIMTADDAYFSDIYSLIVNKLELNALKNSIDRKLAIIKDVLTFYQAEIDSTREDLLNVLIIILIFIELVIGALNYINN
jgi:hypothetical protein